MLAAGVLDWSIPQSAGAATAQAWGLDPAGGNGADDCGGCSACAACRAHAANKLFASAAEADAGRAHDYCKCLVVPLAVLDQSVYDALFLDGGARPSADRRSQWVQAVLTHDPPAQGVPAVAPAPDDGIVHAVLRGAPVLQGAGGARILSLDVDAAEDVTATIVVTRRGRTIARRAVNGVRGRQRLTLALPDAAAAGPANVRLRLRNGRGRSKFVSRGIHIPRARRAAKRA